jgi:nitroreductase
MDGLETLTSRRSVRKFKPDAVPRELLERIVNAGRLAPTARNEQPWEFVVVTDAAKRAKIAPITDYGAFIADAPVCIVVLSKPTKYFLEDCCAATTNILNAATAVGLGSCWVAGDKKPYAGRIVELCAAPLEMKLIALIAIGYPVEVPSPAKRGLNEVLHWETYRGS